jgi:hypothetical protein
MGGFDTHEDKEIEKRVRSNVWNLLSEGRVCRTKVGKRALFTKADISQRLNIGRRRSTKSPG